MRDAGAKILVDGKPRRAGVPLWQGDSKCLLVQERFPEPSSATDTESPLLEIILPPTSEPLPPITHVFGL